jgi:hypothetical protein
MSKGERVTPMTKATHDVALWERSRYEPIMPPLP